MTRGRILVVDDDPGIHRALGWVLAADFTLVDVSDGSEAVALIARGESFDVILLDVAMPIMDGRQTFDEIQRLRPELSARVIIVTGGAPSAELRRWVEGFPRVVEKPVDGRSLYAAIDDVMGQSAK